MFEGSETHVAFNFMNIWVVFMDLLINVLLSLERFAYIMSTYLLLWSYK